MRQRIVTGICLIALLAAFVYLGGWWLRAAVLLLVALSMHEMYAAFRHKGLRPVPVGMALPVLLLVAEIFVAEASRMEAAMAALVLLSVVGVAVVVLSGRAEGERMYATIVPLIYPGAFYILLFSLLRGDEMETTLPLVLMFLVPSMNDCFALFAGLALGKHKLAPQISPKKTVEGAIGGLIAAVVFAMGSAAAGVRDRPGKRAAAASDVAIRAVWPGLGRAFAGGRSGRLTGQARLRHQGFWQDLSRTRWGHGSAGRHFVCRAGLLSVFRNDGMRV